MADNRIQNKKVNSIMERDWSKLPNDIVSCISGKLLWAERIMLSMVCKSWKACVDNYRVINERDKFPWMMCYSFHNSKDNCSIPATCKLVNVFDGKDYIVDASVMDKHKEFFCSARPLASRYGWVLFSKEQRFLSLFSPFTNEVIELPVLEGFHVASFSLSSSSPDCVVFASRIERRKLRIYVCHPGDDAWETYEFEGEKFSAFEVTCGGENFYCYFGNGELGAFNSRLKSWKLLSDENPKVTGRSNVFLVTPHGDPALLHVSREAWRFDLSKNEWMKDNGVEYRTIFFSNPSFSVLTAGRTFPYKIVGYWGIFQNPRSKYSDIVDCQRQEKLDERMLSRDVTYQRTSIHPPVRGVWRARDLKRSNSELISEYKPLSDHHLNLVG